jgi:hypothetical protein
MLKGKCRQVVTQAQITAKLTMNIVDDPVIAKTVQSRTISRYQLAVFFSGISLGPRKRSIQVCFVACSTIFSPCSFGVSFGVPLENTLLVDLLKDLFKPSCRPIGRLVVRNRCCVDCRQNPLPIMVDNVLFCRFPARVPKRRDAIR